METCKVSTCNKDGKKNWKTREIQHLQENILRFEESEILL